MDRQKKRNGEGDAGAPARRMPVWAAFGLTAACLWVMAGLSSRLGVSRGARYLIGCGAGAMGYMIWDWAAGRRDRRGHE